MCVGGVAGAWDRGGTWDRGAWDRGQVTVSHNWDTDLTPVPSPCPLSIIQIKKRSML